MSTERPEIIETWPLDGTAHAVVWGKDGWACSCGTSRTWGTDRAATTGKRASSLHVYWVRRRVWMIRLAAAHRRTWRQPTLALEATELPLAHERAE